ncbi:hypothetical protein V1477_000351 [Vespula maculifrons]|uniref:Uncharacterized protein n=1 Tax=Vespula maculifrons TaxID=7453 RepID=A0ABD2D1C2_VESMC
MPRTASKRADEGVFERYLLLQIEITLAETAFPSARERDLVSYFFERNEPQQQQEEEEEQQQQEEEQEEEARLSE